MPESGHNKISTILKLVPLGYIIGGSNGEPVYLNWDERVEMVKKAKQFSSPDKLLIAGSGCECKYIPKLSLLLETASLPRTTRKNNGR